MTRTSDVEKRPHSSSPQTASNPRHSSPACHCKSVTHAPKVLCECDRSARHAARVTANRSHSLPDERPSVTNLHDSRTSDGGTRLHSSSPKLTATRGTVSGANRSHPHPATSRCKLAAPRRRCRGTAHGVSLQIHSHVGASKGHCDRSAQHAARVTANRSHSLPGERPSVTENSTRGHAPPDGKTLDTTPNRTPTPVQGRTRDP